MLSLSATFTPAGQGGGAGSVVILSLQGGSQVPGDETHQLELNIFLPHWALRVLVGDPQRHNQRPERHPILSPLSNLSANHPPLLLPLISGQWNGYNTRRQATDFSNSHRFNAHTTHTRTHVALYSSVQQIFMCPLFNRFLCARDWYTESAYRLEQR